MDYSFNLYNGLAEVGASLTLKKMLNGYAEPPIIICIGSDLSVGDSLGPLTGSKLKERLRELNLYVYGTLAKPVTAKEVKFINRFMEKTHPNAPIIAIDAAVGVSGDVGLIKIAPRGVAPGSGANKQLDRVGTVSIMGIVAEKSLFNYSLFSSTRLNIVNKMADIIADAVTDFVYSILS